MAQVDVLRFVGKIQELFAPRILEVQVFVAYIDEDTNFFTVQGDNLFSSAGQEDIERISTRLAALATQIDGVEDDCSDIPSMKTQIASLQSDVEALSQGSSEDSSAGASIAGVDDIVYCAYDSHDENPFTPPNLKALRGRGYLDCYYGSIYADNTYSSGGLSGNQVYSRDNGNGNSIGIYAGFGDGKIHTYDYDNYTFSSVSLNHGDFFFNKADNALYIYDANNHKFIKASGKRHYVVDVIADYVGNSLPETFNTDNVRFLQITELYPHIILWYGNGQLSSDVYYYPQDGYCLANIQSILSDDPAIYSVIDGSNGVIVTHDLYDGDTVFNKNDGCTYVLHDNGTDKSFIRISTAPIEPVLDIIHIGNELYREPSTEGEKYIYIDGNSSSLSIASSSLEWIGQSDFNNGQRYASLDNKKIYQFFGGNNPKIVISDVPVGASFLNKADSSLYVYDGSQFIKT